jgi:hypothetical protein
VKLPLLSSSFNVLHNVQSYVLIQSATFVKDFSRSSVTMGSFRIKSFIAYYVSNIELLRPLDFFIVIQYNGLTH